VGTYLACKLARAGNRVLIKDRAPAIPFVAALCADAGVTFILKYDDIRDQAVDFVFVAVGRCRLCLSY